MHGYEYEDEMSSTEWQDALMYAAIWGKADEVLSLVTVDDFDPGDRQDLAVIVERGFVDGSLNAAWVKDEAVRLGRPAVAYVATVITSPFLGTVPYYAERLRQESVRRHATAALTRGIQRLKGSDPYEVVDKVFAELRAIPSPATSDDDAWTLDEVMGLKIEERGYTIPNLLRRNERLVLTGTEGGGKSVFIYQLLTGAAFGVDTFSLERTEPKRVLFLDVENNEFQARANLDKIVPVLREIAPDAMPEWRSLKRRVVDLMASQDRADVLRRVTHYAPDILYMGTAYKLTNTTDDAHRSVRAIQSIVDKIREELDCSVIVEHHAGHGSNNDRNNMRPEGSSYWLRWPDFGYGMKPILQPNGRRLMKLQPWRGDRSTDRSFPVGMRQSDAMPWVPVYSDEWESLYSALEK